MSSIEYSGLAGPMPDDELRTVRALEPQARYEYFIETALRFDDVWGLAHGDDLIRYKLPDGRIALPLWPRQECAALEASDASEQPARISLHDLMEALLPVLTAQNGLVSIFPVEGVSRVLESAELEARLWKEWDEDD